MKTKFLRDSDNDEPEERTIKSGLTKKQEALDKILEETRKHANISDFNAVETDFFKLVDEIRNVSDVLFEGKGYILPIKVLKVFMLIEDEINDVTPEQKKKMSKANQTSYNKIKQKFKKYLAEEGDEDNLYAA